MKYSIYDQLKKRIYKGDLGYKTACYILMHFGYSNHDLQSLQVKYKTYNYVKRKYDINLIESKGELNSRPNLIWILWIQGIENAPEIVKKCVNSVQDKMKDFEVIILSEKNIFEYISLPDYILEKWRKGKITTTHLSDIIRLELLTRYGGIWLDATVYLTDRIPDFLLHSGLFMYSNSNVYDMASKYNNWLIIANKGDVLLSSVKRTLFEYWKKENKIKDYFLWQIIASLYAEKYPELTQQMPCVYDRLPEMLRQNMFKENGKELFEGITNMSTIHKLSYKIEIPQTTSGTIYDIIMDPEDGRIQV